MGEKIFKLSSETIDKIAAGEVVESPSSVVKELVENAIDAKASSIRLEIVGGGLQKIRLLDDGEGMSEQDALMSIERHATSKIARVEDLFVIETMGFRGEALSSISAVSKFSLLTKHKESGDKPATHLILQDGLKVKKGARTIGTTIEVLDLFYNTPARKKFQKSASASLKEVAKVMTKLALSHPNIQFSFFSDGKEIFCVEASTWQQRILDLLPSAYIDKGCLVDEKTPKFHLYGVVGLPSEVKSHRSSQYLFINKRAVTSHFLSSVIADAFATRLQKGEHPIFVLYLEGDPKEIDINVHPQKKEVRFSSEEEIGSIFRKGVSKALTSHENALHASTEVQPKLAAWQIDPIRPDFSKESFDAPINIVQEVALFKEQERDLQMLGSYSSLVFVSAEEFNDVFQDHTIEKGFLVIDLKEVSKRLIYDATYQRLEGEEHAMALQSLFFPLTIEVTYEETLFLEENVALIEKFGLSMRLFGKCHFIIDGIHPMFKEEEIPLMIKEILHVLKGKTRSEYKKREMALLATRFATFSTTHFSRMMKELMHSSSPYFSPTGTPTMAHVKERNLATFFKEFPIEKSH